MKTSQIGKIAVTTSNRPRARFNLSHDVNTTASFGETQPLLCRLLPPGTKSSLNVESLVRLAPMVAPSFGRVKWETWSKFVPISDLMKNFAAMMAQTTVARGANVFTPSRVPYISLNILSFFCLIGAKATLYRVSDTEYGTGDSSTMYLYKTTPSGTGMQSDSGSEMYTAFLGEIGGTETDFEYSWLNGYKHTGVYLRLDALFGGQDQPNVSFKIPLNVGRVLGAYELFNFGNGSVTDGRYSLEYDPVTIDGADYVISRTFSAGYGSRRYAIAFRLSDFGRRLRKILLGCGYQINFDSDTPVNVLPLFAYYKAYWDLFGLTLYDNYESTNCSQFLTYVDFHNWALLNTSIMHQDGPFDLFAKFIYDLANCWVTDTQDFVSANMVSTAVSPQFATGDFIDIDPDDAVAHKGVTRKGLSVEQYSAKDFNDSVGDYGQPWINNVIHSQLDSEVLKRLYKWTNRNTIAGRRIADLLRMQGLGKYVDDCKSDFIGHTETQVSISDVVSTSDTFDSNTDSGALLGEYGGKGLKYDKTKNFVFENDEYGYWITIAAIVPQAGYCQAVDGNNFSVNKEDFYNPEFDGLGMEATKFGQIIGALDWSRGDEKTKLPSSFGFAPRYSRLKTMFNVMNGDFNQRSTRNSYLPFTLDKIIDVGDEIQTDVAENENEEIFLTSRVLPANNLPTAGNSWRYNSRYFWLGNFNRIFVNEGTNSAVLKSVWQSLRGLSGQDSFEINWRSYDNFLIHNVLDFVTWSPMLPIEDSFETKEDGNDGKDDLGVTKA